MWLRLTTLDYLSSSAIALAGIRHLTQNLLYPFVVLHRLQASSAYTAGPHHALFSLSLSSIYKQDVLSGSTDFLRVDGIPVGACLTPCLAPSCLSPCLTTCLTTCATPGHTNGRHSSTLVAAWMYRAFYWFWAVLWSQPHAAVADLLIRVENV